MRVLPPWSDLYRQQEHEELSGQLEDPTCSEERRCLNSNFNRLLLEQPGKCHLCKLAQGQQGYTACYWKPAPADKKPHPGIVKAAQARHKASQEAAAAKRMARSKKKMSQAVSAARAEKRTTSMIRDTVNSGRSFQDGDHVLGDAIRLDTKLQSTRESWNVDPVELEKIRSQAKLYGQYGALVLTNKHGRKVAAMDLKDFSLLFQKTVQK